jgi:hypothetical protein
LTLIKAAPVAILQIFNRQGVTDLFADLHHSGEHGCALVVAILRLAAGLYRSLDRACRSWLAAVLGKARPQSTSSLVITINTRLL